MSNIDAEREEWVELGTRTVGRLVGVASGTAISVWCIDDFCSTNNSEPPPPLDLSDPARAFSRRTMDQLTPVIERRQPEQLHMNRLCVDMGAVCELISFWLPNSVKELAFLDCQEFDAKDIAQLSKALDFASSVKQVELRLHADPEQHALAALAALCNERRYSADLAAVGDQRYVLIKR